MVTRKTSKKSQEVSYVITASFGYGPFKTKSDAEAYRAKVASVPGASVSEVKKLKKGYAFTSKTQIGATNAASKTQVIAEVKKASPSAKISVKHV